MQMGMCSSELLRIRLKGSFGLGSDDDGNDYGIKKAFLDMWMDVAALLVSD